MATRKGTGVRFGAIPTGTALFADTNLAREADKLTRAAGQFRTNAQEALTQAHYVMARAMQQYQVDALEESIKNTGRPQKGTKALEKSILDQRNTVLRANGWAVGIPEWLDQSPAGAYWRVIEEGTGPYDTRGVFFRDRAGTIRSGSGSPVGEAHDAMMLLQMRNSGKAPEIHVSGIDARRYMRDGIRRWSKSNVRTQAYSDWFRIYGFGDYLKLRGELRAR